MDDKVNNIEQTSVGIGTYIIGGVLALSLGYIGYIYTAKDVIEKGDLKDNYIKKSNVENEYVRKSELDFGNLPYYIKDKYVLKSKYEKDINAIKDIEPIIIEKIVEVEKIIEVEKEAKPIVIEKIVNVEKIIEIEKIVEVHNTKIKLVESNNLIVDKTKFQTYTCKTLNSGSIHISKECEKSLNSFLNKNSDAKMFEVIGLVDNKDFKLIENLKDVYGTKRVGKLSLYAKLGISRQRVIEAAWIVKRNLGSFTKINTVNYTVTSKDKRGFVIRAYKK